MAPEAIIETSSEETLDHLCNEMERAIAYARSRTPDEGCVFLSAWTDRLWDVIAREFPEFKLSEEQRSEMF